MEQLLLAQPKHWKRLLGGIDNSAKSQKINKFSGAIKYGKDIPGRVNSTNKLSFTRGVSSRQ